MALSVTAAESGAGAYNGMALTVKVLTGQASSPIGATASSGSITTPEVSITPSGTGSYVYGAVYNANVQTLFTAAANTTFSQNVGDNTNGVAYGTFRLTATTTASTPVTVGATAPAETAGYLSIALLEILKGTGLAEDSSSPAGVNTTSAETLSTAVFTPPAGSLLVAQVVANSTGDGTNSMAVTVSDSSGLTWTRRAFYTTTIGSATYEAVSIWTATVPAATAAPVFDAAYSPASGNWTSNTSPKTQTATLSPGNLVVVLGGTQLNTTTLGTPTGVAGLTLAKSVVTSGYCAGYAWAAILGALAVTTTSLPAATESSAYSTTLTATGGAGGYTWSISGGSLPSWASLNSSTGVISGTPNAVATTNFTAEVTDAASNTATAPLSLTVNSASSNPVGPSGSWTLVFEDDFPGTSLNTDNWTALNATINGCTTVASNVSVSGGNCILQASGTSSCAMIDSNPSNNGYGSGSDGPTLAVGDCCEAKVSFPGPSGDSAYDWPSWWASGGDWPANGEEDIFESFNGTPSALNYHSPSGSNNGPNPSGSWCNSFHTYTLVRGSGTNGLQVWWDGTLERSVTPSDSGGPQSLLVSQLYGAGPNAPSTEASQILVEYVRMWTPG